MRRCLVRKRKSSIRKCLKMNEKKVRYDVVNLREVEKKTILDTLHLYKWNRTQAAFALGISIRTLRNKLRQYGINGPVQQSEKL